MATAGGAQRIAIRGVGTLTGGEVAFPRRLIAALYVSLHLTGQVRRQAGDVIRRQIELENDLAEFGQK